MTENRDDLAASPTSPGRPDAGVAVLWREAGSRDHTRLNRSGFWTLGPNGTMRLTFAVTLAGVLYRFAIRPRNEEAGPGHTIYARELRRQATLRGLEHGKHAAKEVRQAEIEKVLGEWPKFPRKGMDPERLKKIKEFVDGDRKDGEGDDRDSG